MFVIHEFKVLIVIFENRPWAPVNHQPGQWQRRTRELQIRLLQVIQVQVGIPTGPDELTGLEVALLGKHMGEQRIAGDVERYAEKHVGTALVELTREATTGHVELEQGVTGHQRHLLQLANIPGAHHDPARIGIAPQLLDRMRDLIDGVAIRSQPRAPLLAVHGSELTLLVRPFVPDGDAVLAQPRDIRISPEKPQQLVDYRTQMNLLRGDERKAIAEIET